MCSAESLSYFIASWATGPFMQTVGDRVMEVTPWDLRLRCERKATNDLAKNVSTDAE
jgi:hypothetical protein